MISFYFKLQYKMLNRRFREWGFHPIVAPFFFISAFIALSYLLFYKINYAEYIYALAGLIFSASISSKKRSEFLKSSLNNRHYILIRILESACIVFPFVIFLLFKGEDLLAASLFLLALSNSLLKLNSMSEPVIPTPFSRYPFEFTKGFRAAFPLFIIVYILFFIGLKVGNFNLSLFMIGFLAVICAFFYLGPENTFFVWTFKKSINRFLISKIKIALFYFIMSALPLIICIFAFYPEKYLYILALIMISVLIVITAVLSKYSAYPDELNIKKSLAIIISLWLPVLFLLLIPYFYKESKLNLKEFLHD